MSTHYCDGCNAGDDDEDAHDEWCCGGDNGCESWEAEPSCAEGRDHDWTSEGTGGCRENPGVWSVGGTVYTFTRRCKRCGMGEHITDYGSQRNPGQCDLRRYEREEFAG